MGQAKAEAVNSKAELNTRPKGLQIITYMIGAHTTVLLQLCGIAAKLYTLNSRCPLLNCTH